MDKMFIADASKAGFSFKILSTDNAVFRLHYFVTFPALLILSIAVTLTQYFGDPISCIQRDDIPEKVINTYCWIESTFSLSKSFNKRIGDEIVYPGIEQYKKGDEVMEHAYYQWVCFVLLLQGIMFYLTRILWNAWEGEKVSKLLMGLHRPLLDTEDRDKKIGILCKYFSDNLWRHNGYAIKYFICEILNFVNAIGQMYLINRFLGGEFTTYGYRVFQFMKMDQQNRTDPMIKVFPRVTKCTFHKFGSAGSVQTHDSLCVLPLNIVHEKIYVFLWLWLVLLTALSALAVLYRVLVIGLPNFRGFLMEKRNSFAKDEVKEVVKYINFGDWFLLHLLSKNIHSLNFRKFVAVLAKELEEKCVLDEEMKLVKKPKSNYEIILSTLPLEPSAKST